MSDASDSKDHSYTGTKLDNFAELLGVRTKDLNNQDLYLMIDEWMGAPHRYGGMNKRGVDCSGFVTLLYNRIYDKDLPRTSRDMAGQIKRKYRKQLKEGDLVFFRLEAAISITLGSIFITTNLFTYPPGRVLLFLV